MALNHHAVLLVGALTVFPLLTACGIDVSHDDIERKTDVEITTPVGDLTVRTNVDRPDTGLPVFPGAQPLSDDSNDPDNAWVTIGSRWFGVEVVAAKYEHQDAPEAIAAYYREQMGIYGHVTVCRGRFDSRGKRWVCRENPASANIQLLTTTGEIHRIVAVKPRGRGSEFAVVRVEAHGRRAEASTP